MRNLSAGLYMYMYKYNVKGSQLFCESLFSFSVKPYHGFFVRALNTLDLKIIPS